MKRITITYRMSKPGFTIAKKITIPADSFMVRGLFDFLNDRDSLSEDAVNAYVAMTQLCSALATLAGYDKGSYEGFTVSDVPYSEEDE